MSLVLRLFSLVVLSGFLSSCDESKKKSELVPDTCQGEAIYDEEVGHWRMKAVTQDGYRYSLRLYFDGFKTATVTYACSSGGLQSEEASDTVPYEILNENKIDMAETEELKPRIGQRECRPMKFGGVVFQYSFRGSCLVLDDGGGKPAYFIKGVNQ